MNPKMTNALESIQEMPDELRKVVIQNLWQDISELPTDLENLSWEYKDMLQAIFERARNDPSTIPTLRYELETYTNDLDPDFSSRFIEENQGKLVRILDIWAWPWDVTLRSYKKLLWLWVIPKVYAFERSSRFRKQITSLSIDTGIFSKEIEETLWSPNYPGIFPVDVDVQTLARQYIWQIDMIVWNYVLDRVPQRSLLNDIIKKGIPNIQFTNCVPLQYQNPNTGQSYIDQGEIIVPEWASDLWALWEFLNMQEREDFFWINAVSSLQDGEERFNYAGIRWKI